jgi:hypothetical protein
MDGETEKKIELADETIDAVSKIVTDAGKTNFEKQKGVFGEVSDLRGESGVTPSALPETPSIPHSPLKAPEVVIKNLRTFQGDVAEAIKNQNASVLTITMAEKRKQDENAGESQKKDLGKPMNEVARILGKKLPPGLPYTPPPAPPPILPTIKIEDEKPKKGFDPEFVKNSLTIGISILLIVLGVGAVVGFYMLQKKPPTIATLAPVDQTIIPFNYKENISSVNTGREDLITSINTIRGKPGAGNNEITYISLTKVVEKEIVSLSTQELFSILKTSIPASLLRAFGDQFMLGMYHTTSNQPFLLIKLDSFENTFAGMLLWEKTMNTDIGSIFSERSVQITSYVPVTVATSGAGSATNTAVVGSTTAITKIVNTDIKVRNAFEDITIQNKDARVLKNVRGDDIILYSFLDPNTLLITSSETAFHEIINKYLANKLVR